MAGLSCLFVIQGEGRGHLTQAMALDSMLQRAGHHVCSAIVSKGGDHAIPEYFEEGFSAPVSYVHSLHFVIDNKTQGIHWPKTLIANSKRWNHFTEAFATINNHLDSKKPDVIINFYEPLGGLFTLWNNSTVPTIAVAHQFMFLHPQYPFPDGFGLQKRSAELFTTLTGIGAARRLALSLYDAPPQRNKRLVVVPPILRDELFKVTPSSEHPYYLVYLFHHSLAAGVIKWHKRNPSIPIHCFWNNTKAKEVESHDATLTFHRLHGKKFLEMMAECRGVVTTSGFESLAEAMYLGKPLLANPVRKHFEQHCNAVDGGNLGAAIQSDGFDLNALVRFVSEYDFDATGFREWVGRAEEMVVAQIEEVASQR